MTIRVLMIDADASNRELFRRMLRRAGDAKVDFLDEATLAEAADYNPADLDVVLLDEAALRHAMPVQHWLTSSLNLPAVIVLTSLPVNDDDTGTGFFERLSKSDCTTEELVMAVRYAAQLTALKRELARHQAARPQLRNSLQQPGEVSVREPIESLALELNGRLSGLVHDLRRLLNTCGSVELRQVYADTLDACTRFESALRLANQPQLPIVPAAQFHPAMGGDHHGSDFHGVYRRY
jgi:hypothetical protein